MFLSEAVHHFDSFLGDVSSVSPLWDFSGSWPDILTIVQLGFATNTSQTDIFYSLGCEVFLPEISSFRPALHQCPIPVKFSSARWVLSVTALHTKSLALSCAKMARKTTVIHTNIPSCQAFKERLFFWVTLSRGLKLQYPRNICKSEIFRDLLVALTQPFSNRQITTSQFTFFQMR